MVHFLKKIVFITSIFLIGSNSLANPPVYGPLQAQNNLNDVDNPSTSLANLGGLSSTTAASTYSPIANPTFTGTVTIPSGSVLNTPTSINLSNASGLPYTALPSISSNQILGALTATTPSGQSVPSCSASINALQWTSGTGFGCNSSINAGTLGGATFSSPGAIGSGTASTGQFTTLSSTSNDSLFYKNSSGQSFSTNTTTIVTGWTKVTDRVNSNFNAATGVFTAPNTGEYFVSAGIEYSSSTPSASNEQYDVIVVANSVQLCAGKTWTQSTSATAEQAVVGCIAEISSGQTITVQAFQTSGSTVTQNSSEPTATYISINRIP